MAKLKYQKVENYKERKEHLLAGFKGVIGSIPNGFDNDLFVSAVLKIEDYYKTKFPNLKIPANAIPDENLFPLRLKEYTISQLIHRRIAKNVHEVKFTENFNENETAMAYYNHTYRNIQIFNNKLKSNIERALSSYKLKDFESKKDFTKLMTEECLVHELLHAITDNENMIGFDMLDDSIATPLNEGMTENIALEISGLKNCYSKYTLEISDKRFGLRGQTSTGYILENNIANLVRIAAEEDLTLPYLVDVKQAKFGLKDKEQIYASSSPLTIVAETLAKFNNVTLQCNQLEAEIKDAKEKFASATDTVEKKLLQNKLPP